MSSYDGMKEVYFDQYCKTCEYYEESEDGKHCYECLEDPVNQYSHKPINYKEKR